MEGQKILMEGKTETVDTKAETVPGEKNAEKGVQKDDGAGTTQPGTENGAVKGAEEKREQDRTIIKKSLFLQYFIQNLGMVGVTCEKVGINRETYHRWLKADEEFRLGIQRSFKTKLEDVEALAAREMIKGNSSLIRHFLDRRHPLYKPKVKVEGPVSGEKSLEEELDELDFDETENEQSEGDPKTVQDSEQAGEAGEVQPESGAAVLLGTEDAKKPDPEGAAEGVE